MIQEVQEVQRTSGDPQNPVDTARRLPRCHSSVPCGDCRPRETDVLGWVHRQCKSPDASGSPRCPAGSPATDCCGVRSLQAGATLVCSMTLVRWSRSVVSSSRLIPRLLMIAGGIDSACRRRRAGPPPCSFTCKARSSSGSRAPRQIANSLQTLEQRRQRRRLERQAFPEFTYRHRLRSPQGEHHQILRVGEVHRLQQRAVHPDHPPRPRPPERNTPGSPGRAGPRMEQFEQN